MAYNWNNAFIIVVSAVFFSLAGCGGSGSSSDSGGGSGDSGGNALDTGVGSSSLGSGDGNDISYYFPEGFDSSGMTVLQESTTRYYYSDSADIDTLVFIPNYFSCSQLSESDKECSYWDEEDISAAVDIHAGVDPFVGILYSYSNGVPGPYPHRSNHKETDIFTQLPPVQDVSQIMYTLIFEDTSQGRQKISDYRNQLSENGYQCWDNNIAPEYYPGYSWSCVNYQSPRNFIVNMGRTINSAYDENDVFSGVPSTLRLVWTYMDESKMPTQ
jgi:hypothetical protein